MTREERLAEIDADLQRAEWMFKQLPPEADRPDPRWHFRLTVVTAEGETETNAVALMTTLKNRKIPTDVEFGNAMLLLRTWYEERWLEKHGYLAGPDGDLEWTEKAYAEGVAIR